MSTQDAKEHDEDEISIKEEQGLTIAQQKAFSEKEKEKENIKIAMAVLFYFFISISLVFLNKAIMRNYRFDKPLFITWYQQVIAIICIIILGKLGRQVPSLDFLPPFQFNPTIAQGVMPLTCVLIGMVSFNNLCLQYVEVSFYQVARSLSICFSLLLTYLVLGIRTSKRAIQACIIVFVGFFLGSLGEVNFSWLGVIFGVASSFFVALYGIFVKKVLPKTDGNEWKLLSYNTALSIPMLLPIVIISGELSGITEEPLVYDSEFWIVMTITGVFGYLISLAIFLQIKLTSPLTNTISGTVKACVQTILSVLIWNNDITFTNALGIILVIGGSCLYGMIRYYEMRK